MRIQVIDNLLDNFLIKYLNRKFLYDTPHILRGGSMEGTPPFYLSNLNPEELMIGYIYRKIINEILNIDCSIIRTYLNIQHRGMDGSFHPDDGDVTLLLMITDNPKEGGGEFEYIDKNDQINKIEYKQNRLIAFDASIKHRGLAYKGNESRITLAYKLKINKNDILASNSTV
jgi:hypothetical protein